MDYVLHVITKENLYAIPAVIAYRFSLVITKVRNIEDKLIFDQASPQKFPYKFMLSLKSSSQHISRTEVHISLYMEVAVGYHN